VLNWNGFADTREALRSLLAQDWPDLGVHLIDNASADDEAGRLAAEFGDRIAVHRNPANLGFAEGHNVVLRPLLEDPELEFVLLLNNDAVAEPGWIAALVRAADAAPSIGAVASRMLCFDDPSRIENTGVLALTNGDFLPRDRDRPAAAASAGGDVIGVCGGAALYRAAMLRQIGLFRTDFFVNFEDVDLALRATALGWRCVYAPDARVRHRLSRSIDRVRDDEFRIRSLRNGTLAAWINLPWPVVLLNLPWFLITHLALLPLAIVLGQARIARIICRGRWRAARDWRLVRAERRRLRPLRRTAWWRIWGLQRSCFGPHLRSVWRVLIRRERGFLE
jgi:GT2 family glycosyltransferase